MEERGEERGEEEEGCEVAEVGLPTTAGALLGTREGSREGSCESFSKASDGTTVGFPEKFIEGS